MYVGIIHVCIHAYNVCRPTMCVYVCMYVCMYVCVCMYIGLMYVGLCMYVCVCSLCTCMTV